MKPNVGTLDRGLRIFLGLALITLTWIGPKTPYGFIGLIPFVTGLVGICPLYSLFGFNTCPLKPKPKAP